MFAVYKENEKEHNEDNCKPIITKTTASAELDCQLNTA